MTVRINKQKINLREKLAEFEDKVNFDEVVRGLGENTAPLILNKDGGNVGIGTTIPTQPLDVRTQAVVGNGTDGVKITYSKGNSSGIIDTGFSSTALEFRTGNSFAALIDSSGNVGIGTTSPTAPLDIENDVSGFDVDGHLVIQNKPGAQDGDCQGIGFSCHGNTGDGNIKNWFGTVHADTYGRSDFIFLASNDMNNSPVNQTHEVLRITSDGNVGIGTTDPGAYKLYINGTARVSGGDVTSDDRVKHNEQNIVGAIETLSKITPKKYIKTTEMYEADHDFELDADGNPIDADGKPVEHGIEAGVIAQQVLTVPELAFMVSPEGVDEDGNVTSPHGLNYNSLFTYAIAAIQEQQSIIQDLKSRIETLESK